MNEPHIDLLEAEELRKAIIGGEVDAFVVGGGDDTRKVLLLANAYQRYRYMVERMHQGAVTATLEGSILYANQRFSDMLGVPLARLYTAPLQSYVGVAERARLSRFLTRGGRGADLEVTFSRHDGTPVPARLSLVAFDGYASVLVTDLRPLQWAQRAVDALDSIRDSLEKSNAELSLNAQAREAVDNISEALSGLVRLIDDLRENSAGVPPA